MSLLHLLNLHMCGHSPRLVHIAADPAGGSATMHAHAAQQPHLCCGGLIPALIVREAQTLLNVYDGLRRAAGQRPAELQLPLHRPAPEPKQQLVAQPVCPAAQKAQPASRWDGLLRLTLAVAVCSLHVTNVSRSILFVSHVLIHQEARLSTYLRCWLRKTQPRS